MDADKTFIRINLQSFIKCKEELRDVMKNVNSCLNSTYVKCLANCLNSSENVSDEEKLKIESMLDYLHDELNTGHWSEIPLTVRRAFTGASYIKCLTLLRSSTSCTRSFLVECLKCLDMGLLLGAPLQENPQLLTDCASFLSKKLNEIPEKYNDLEVSKIVLGGKRKLHNEQSSKFYSLKGTIIETESCPSLETFNRKYFSKKLPVILQDCMTHWPATTKWTNIDYLLQVAGDRTVPVEIGLHYVDNNWCQKLLTLKDFIRNYFLDKPDNIGYLAQHNLFNQISELRNDFYIPDYCCLGENDEEPDINAWFGPAKTVSPLHHDPKNNILAQIFGTKQIILYSPNDGDCLYPHEGTLLSNTAQVDPLNPDIEKYPNFENAKAYKCLLEPGEMLYIPPKWWHHVTALDKSFSVSFWWE